MAHYSMQIVFIDNFLHGTIKHQGADASVRNALIKDIHDSAQPQDISCSLVSRLDSTLHASTRAHSCSANNNT